MQESLEASLVRIRADTGRVVGAGFLVGERQVLTCAHVVSQALGLPDHALDPPQGLVSLDFPLLAPRTLLTARVVQWCPPLSDGRGDIAGLELSCDPPAGAEVVRFAPAEDVWEHAFRAFGFPAGYDDGVWATGRLLGRQATDWVMIEDVKAQGFAVGPGFSGAPVWDTQAQGVVGMVVAASRPTDTKTAFVLSLKVLAAAWPLLTIPQGQPRNPYKGLRPFTQRDAGDFFGREAAVEKLVELVNSLVAEQPARSSTRLLTILGPSGAGKSSLVMAGLLPQLQQGALPGSKEWVYLDPMVPGKRPIEALASTLKPHFPDTSFKTLREDLEDEAARGLHLLATQLAKQRGTRVVLLIDQCEELFTQTESEDERQRFIRLLLTACSEPRGPLVVLLTLRADFYDRPMQYPELFRLIETQHLSLLAIEPDDLRRVIEQPAALADVQVTFEGDLVNRLLADVQGQVGALPLLQFTLDQLFQRRSGRQLTLSAYRELGGVKGALTKQAEEIYTTLPSEEHRKLARALFVRLIDPGATEQDTTRRRAALSEFTLDDPIQARLMRETIDVFITARLLTTNEIAGTTTIEVSHEALIREWPRLAGWLREARDDIPLQQAISEDVAEWERRGKPRDRLYRGSQLKEARAWARRNTPSGSEVAFLRAGAAQRVRFVASMTVIVLLQLSTTGLSGWFWFLFPLDLTHVTNPSAPSTIPIYIETLLVQPFFVIGLLCLWAYPFAARFWRKRAVAAAQPGWAWLEPSPGQAIPSVREPVQFRLALLVGIAGALLFCGILVALRLWIRLTVSEAVRGLYGREIALGVVIWAFSRAAMIQGGIALVTAAWARRSGVLLALFAAFIAGCVMTIGFLGLNLLLGGSINLDFTWIILIGIVIPGGLLAVLFAPVSALLAKWIGPALRAALVGVFIYCVLILCMTIGWRFITRQPATSDQFVSIGITLLVLFQVLVGAIVAGRSRRRGWLYGLFAAFITGWLGHTSRLLAANSTISSFAQSSEIILAGVLIAITGMLFALPVALIVFFAAGWTRRSRLRKNAGTSATTKAHSR